MADSTAQRATVRIPSLPQQPPHSVEAEQSVLGGLMLNNQAFFDLADRLDDADFYRTDHQLIYRAISALIGNDWPCDFVTLSERLRRDGKLDEAGGPEYLASLATDTYSIANLLSYADIVRERAVRRALIAAGAEIGEMGFRPEGRSLAELLDVAEQKVFEIARQRTSAAEVSNDAILTAIEDRLEKREAIKGLMTGFVEFDHRTQGLHAGEVTILAARPGKGKTSFAMNIVEHVAVEQKIPAAVFSMEMGAEQLLLRTLSSVARVGLRNLRSGDLNDADMDRLAVAGGLLRAAPIIIDETEALSPLELRARARRLVQNRGVKLIVVDYLQLMQVPGSRENRTNDVSEISRQIKSMAKALGVPVIALSQLGRDVDKRANKRPNLGDLRESGQIEADADMVLFVHRDEDNDKHEAEIIIGKGRNVPVGDFKVEWHGSYCRFDNARDLP